MKINCKSCGQGHFIPDESLASAPADGLRIRCSKCRAIMAVDRAIAKMHGEETLPDLPTLRKRPAQGAGVPELTDVRLLDDNEVPIPALVKGSVVEPLPGVRRDVTGLHLPTGRAAKAQRDDRVWFAAIGGRARGPYSEAEMRDLAARGKVRGRTRVWRPGFDGWMRVRTGADELEELAWLRAVVIRRKRAEREASDRARARLGVKTLTLESESGARVRAPGDLGSGEARERTPPPLPSEPVTGPGVSEDAILDAARARRAREAMAVAAVLPDADFRVPDAPSADPYELIRAPTPILATVSDAAFTVSEVRAAYGHRRAAKVGVLAALLTGLGALAALYAAPSFSRFLLVVEGWLRGG